jgi:hypothetical protein
MVVEPETFKVPVTPKVATGEDEPIPTLPLARTVRSWELEEEATVKMGVEGRVEEPSTVKRAVGVEEFKER